MTKKIKPSMQWATPKASDLPMPKEESVSLYNITLAAVRYSENTKGNPPPQANNKF